VKIVDGEFKNIHVCYKYNNCTNIKNDEIMVQRTEFITTSGMNSSFKSMNVTIDNMNGGRK